MEPQLMTQPDAIAFMEKVVEHQATLPVRERFKPYVLSAMLRMLRTGGDDNEEFQRTIEAVTIVHNNATKPTPEITALRESVAREFVAKLSDTEVCKGCKGESHPSISAETARWSRTLFKEEWEKRCANILERSAPEPVLASPKPAITQLSKNGLNFHFKQSWNRQPAAR